MMEESFDCNSETDILCNPPPRNRPAGIRNICPGIRAQSACSVVNPLISHLYCRQSRQEVIIKIKQNAGNKYTVNSQGNHSVARKKTQTPRSYIQHQHRYFRRPIIEKKLHQVSREYQQHLFKNSEFDLSCIIFKTSGLTMVPSGFVLLILPSLNVTV